MQWYISQDGKTSGPFAEQRVAMLVSWRKITRAAYICDEQSSCWVSILRSQFGPLLTASADPMTSDAASDDKALDSRAGITPRTWSTTPQRLALVALLLLGAAALLLALRFSPAPGSDRSPQGRAAAHALRVP
jgi:hypothetical protein